VDTPDGRIHLVPVDIIPANERPDADYPFVLITGRQLEHWHTGSMTRRSAVLDALEPTATASLCGPDLQALGLAPGDVMTVRSRRGQVTLHVRQDDGTPTGAVFIPIRLLRGGGQPDDQRCAGPIWQDTGVQVLRRAVERGGILSASAGYMGGK
jgi:formate dehydrogenase major subunit